MIPDFDKNNVLPPYLGKTPTERSMQSPYRTDIMEVCKHFCTSPARINILRGYVQFRLDTISHGIFDGIQWIDGSFVENIEVSDSRDPHDIDIVSMLAINDPSEELRIVRTYPEFASPILSKKKYFVDHYPVVVNRSPLSTLQDVKYWIQLFGHNRKGVWKGMLELPMYRDTTIDTQAMNFLNSI